MRPLTVRMSGLRSYRSEETIDFSDVGLMAIVGDTGAGKSSILEALFFALYGGCTWDHRAVVPLIADGCEVMQVELTFVAEGRTWKVFRSASRSGAQSRHELSCIEDPSVRFDNDGPVTTEIQRLVGLDRDAFLRTVVLPQGRFQALLQATKGDRTAILKGIFRLEQLAAVRDQADLVARRLRPRVESLKLERAALLVDPAAALTEAEDRHEQASQRQSKLRSFAERVSTANRQRDEFDRRALELESCGRKLTEALLPTAADELAALAESKTRIVERRGQLDVEREQRQGEVNKLSEILRKAEDAGEGIRGLAGAASTLASLREQMPWLDDEATGCAEEAEAVERLSQDILAYEATTVALQDQAVKSRSESEEFAQTVELANSRLEQARQRLHVAREKITELSSRRDEAAKAVDRARTAGDEVEAASADSQAATARLQVARERLAAIRRVDAAAHAAEGCQPGDACPICDRSLPANFSAPTSPGDAGARSDLASAEQAASEAFRTLATRQADLANANRDRERAEKVVDEAERSLITALEDLRTVIPAASLDADDESILAPLITAASTVAGNYEELRSKETRLGNDAARATATLEAQRAERQRRKVQLEKRQESLRARRLACEAAAAGLPSSYRVAPPLTQTTLADAEGRIVARQAELAKVERQLAQARHLVDDLGRRLDSLNEDLRADVEGPAQRLVPKLVILAQRHDDLAARLDLAPAAARPESRLSDEAEWAGRLQVMAVAALAAGEKSIGELRAQRDGGLWSSPSCEVRKGVDRVGQSQFGAGWPSQARPARRWSRRSKAVCGSAAAAASAASTWIERFQFATNRSHITSSSLTKPGSTSGMSRPARAARMRRFRRSSYCPAETSARVRLRSSSQTGASVVAWRRRRSSLRCLRASPANRGVSLAARAAKLPRPRQLGSGTTAWAATRKSSMHSGEASTRPTVFRARRSVSSLQGVRAAPTRMRPTKRLTSHSTLP